MSGAYSIGRLQRTRADGTTYWSYCIKWDDSGGSHRSSLGTQDRSAAEAKARDFWTRRKLAYADNVGAIVEAYLESPGGQKDGQRKRDAWAAAKPFWGALRVEQIIPDPDDTAGQGGSGAEYQRQRGKAANTMRKELGVVSSALAWGKKNRLVVGEVPFIRLPAIPESEVEHLSKAQFRRFLAGCSAPHVQLFAQLAITTGARAAALFELPWIRVDLEARIINLNPPGRAQIANKSRARVPINDRLYPLLVEARDAALTPFVIEQHGERIASIKKGFAAASERSGVHCTPHMLRHSAAVWMAENRVPMEEIAAYLGHKDTRITTRVYARFHPDYLRRAARALDW